MIEKLQQIEDKKILELLSKPEEWKTLLIDYFPPVVERCWIQLGHYRLLLHFIHECKPEEALFHSHRWPSAMHVLNGKYEMGLGFGPGTTPPEKMATILFDNGGYYDMTHIDSWHYVRPIGGVCATVMLTGKLWDREETATDFGKLGPLSEKRKHMMLEWFSNWYRNKIQSQKAEENRKIMRGDWVKFDQSVMSVHDKRGIEAYLDKNGFVIGVDGNLIDIRFGNDRMKIQSKFLSLLDPSTKPEVPVKTEKKEEKTIVPQESFNPLKKLDDMDKSNWPDDEDDDIMEDWEEDKEDWTEI